MQDLRLTLIQDKLVWEDRKANLIHFTEVIHGLAQADIIALPEMFNSGFSVRPEGIAETMEGPTITWMKNQAAFTGSAVVGTLVVREGQAYFNRLVWVNPDTSLSYYDKRHLFRMGGEHERFSMGSHRQIIAYKGWKILPLVCYDLRFPVWSSNRMKFGRYEYDLMLYLANWPASRSFVWKSLLLARALENQSYVAGLNRVGVDGQEMDYSGDSVILSPKGEVKAELPSAKAGVLSALLSYEDMVAFREKFQVARDWDVFYIPGTNLEQD